MIQVWLSVLERSDRILSKVHSWFLAVALQREVPAITATRHSSNENITIIILLFIVLVFIV